MNGRISDVAAFFRVSERTVHKWKSAQPPLLSFWQEGGNVIFSEESVLDLWERGYVASRRMKPGESREHGRRAWAISVAAGNGNGIEERLERVEEQVRGLLEKG